MDLETYLELTKEAERYDRDVAREEGALGQLLQQLREKVGCTTETAGRKKLLALEKELSVSETQADEALAHYRKKWSKQLGE